MHKYTAKLSLLLLIILEASIYDEGVLRGFCPRGFCPRGFCPRGFCPRGFCPRGFCPRGFCPEGVLSGGVFVRRGFCPTFVDDMSWHKTQEAGMNAYI